jgi:AhpD family alkylhydroperoxidase
MADVPEELKELLHYFPKYWSEAEHLFTETLYELVKLDRKTIELILLALLAGRRWETGVKVHTAAALQHGATPEEIRGALLMSIAVFGNSSAVSGLHWAEPILAAAGGAPTRANRNA